MSREGKLTLVTKDLTRPNGIAFSPDEKTLYIAVSDPDKPVLMAYDLQEDGTIKNGRVLFDAKPLTPGKKGLPDGMKVDREGNIFLGGPGGDPGAGAGRHAPRHDRQRRPPDRQLRLGRRRLDALHHQQHEHRPHQDRHEGQAAGQAVKPI